MMSFKLAITNIRKSLKDYAVYFATVTLGVAIFYVFNAMDSSNAMLSVSQREMMKTMVTIMGYLSVFVSIVLAFLIIYASNYLIKRRKKEFGVYLTLGMPKGQLSLIILIENILMGLVSLAFGLFIGVAGSQLMSMLTAQLFEADMSKFQFAFSMTAFTKTLLYFSIIYIAEIVLNTVAVGRLKLIDLLNAAKKNESIKVKNTVLSVVIFLISVLMLGYAYYLVCGKPISTLSESDLGLAIALGLVGTFLLFYSVSGFILKLVQSRKKLYYKDLNAFTLRQINAKINTTVVSMSIISILLFLTICILSSGLSINSSLRQQNSQMLSADYMLTSSTHRNPATTLLQKKGVDIRKYSRSYGYATIYRTTKFTMYDSFKNIVVHYDHQAQYKETGSTKLTDGSQALLVGRDETFIGLSDYNAIAKVYHEKTYTLTSHQFVMVCNYDSVKKFRNQALEKGRSIQIGNQTLTSKYGKCQDGFYDLNVAFSNTGFYIVSDQMLATLKSQHQLAYFFNIMPGRYKAMTKSEKQALEDKISSDGTVALRTSLLASSVGVATIATFIGIYLGIVFLITSAAILALKQLSDVSDDIARYDVLRKIGCNDAMLNKALFIQTAIFFLAPLVLAIIHSIFGLIFSKKILLTMGASSMGSGIVLTAVMLVVIYGGYFLITYLTSKRIIHSRITQ